MANTRKRNFQSEVQKLIANAPVYDYKERFTVGAVNGGTVVTVLPAVRGFKYRLIDYAIVAIGGTTAGGTNVLLKGTQGGSSATLLTILLAALTRGAQNKRGVGTVTILTDNASFGDCDENTAITFEATGTFTGATHFDVELFYTLEKAA